MAGACPEPPPPPRLRVGGTKEAVQRQRDMGLDEKARCISRDGTAEDMLGAFLEVLRQCSEKGSGGECIRARGTLPPSTQGRPKTVTSGLPRNLRPWESEAVRRLQRKRDRAMRALDAVVAARDQ